MKADGHLLNNQHIFFGGCDGKKSDCSWRLGHDRLACRWILGDVSIMAGGYMCIL